MSETVRILPGTDARRSLRTAMGERIPISMAEARAAWLEDCVLAGRTPQTLRTYRAHSKLLIDVKPRRVVTGFESAETGLGNRLASKTGDVSDFTSTVAREILGDLIRRDVAFITVRTIWATFSTFAAFCVLRGWLAENPMPQVSKPRVREKPHRYLSPDELRRLWAATDLPQIRRKDETKLILLLLMEGLRAGELCALRWQDVKADRIVVAFGKGGRVRAIPLSDRAKALLARQQRSGPRIFRCGVAALEERFRRLSRLSGVPGVHPHLMRHTFGSSALAAGMDEGTIRTLGGWAPGSRVFERYVRSAREDSALKVARAFDLTEHLLDG